MGNHGGKTTNPKKEGEIYFGAVLRITATIITPSLTDRTIDSNKVMDQGATPGLHPLHCFFWLAPLN